MTSSPASPALVLRNRQRSVAFQTPWIRRVVIAALPDCLAAAHSRSPLRHLTTIEATLISDPAIATIHDSFFQDPTPTDVITFDHGEILLGAGTIAAQAPDFSHTSTEEAALCLIHGILHLGGWKDQSKKEARVMAAEQRRIFRIAANR
ncbi:MAG: rRNA maturation RNase YbeY [Terrimicrobiaceae bacterium]